MTIKTPAEFSFRECLTFLNRSDNECLHSVENLKVRKLLKVQNNLFLVEIFEKRKNSLQVEFLTINPGELITAYTKEYIKEWFHLSYDIKPFYEMAEKDALLRSIVKKYYGLRLIGIPDFFEAVIWAIIGQHINLSLAYSMKRSFVEAFGEALRYENKTYWLFPEPETVANIRVDDLMMFKFTGKKAEYIIGVAEKIKKGIMSVEKLMSLNDYEEVRKNLKSLKGVGDWTADYVMMKYFHYPEAFPLEDVGLHNAIKQNLNLQNKPSVDKIRELAFNWRGFEAYATFYLWRSLI